MVYKPIDLNIIIMYNSLTKHAQESQNDALWKVFFRYVLLSKDKSLQNITWNLRNNLSKAPTQFMIKPEEKSPVQYNLIIP